MKKIKITFPVKSCYESEEYGLIIEDSAGVTHYFNFDGSYDGWCSDTCVDGETGVNLN